MRSVCIAGASGFIGSSLVHRLKLEGFNISILRREDFQNGKLDELLKGCSIVINLVGESIAGIWTKKKKRKIYDSRVLSSRKLISSINRSGDGVKLLIQVSGVGIYDNLNIHSENSRQYDTGFLSRVITDWEGELSHLHNPDIRVVILRLGVVLDKSGGLLKQMLFPLRWSPGFGVDSEDYFPYIDLDDLINAFLFCIEREKIQGIVNVVAPALTKINHFFRVLMRILKKRRIIWIKRKWVKLFAGESGSLLVSGQNVIPEKLLKEGFIFRYDNIEDALNRACN
jgi:uncharacterized protein (TIGR01777 family)